MKTLMISGLILVSLTGAVFSQVKYEAGDNVNTINDKLDSAEKQAVEAQKKRMKLDAAYKAALDKVKEPNVAHDPWANMRPASPK